MGKERSLDLFLTKQAGKSDELKDIDNVIAAYGDFKEIKDIDVVIRRLTNLFMIPEGTYFFDPDLGTNIYKHIFEPVDLTTKLAIERDLKNVIRIISSPKVNINYNVLFFKNKKGFRVNLVVEYLGRKKKVSINIDENILKTIK